MVDPRSIRWELFPFQFVAVPTVDDLIRMRMEYQVAQMGENLSSERGKLRPLSTPCGGNVFEFHNRVDKSVSTTPLLQTGLALPGSAYKNGTM